APPQLECSDLAAEEPRTAAVAVAVPLEDVDEARQRRPVAELEPAHVERDRHGTEQRLPLRAVDPLADAVERRQRAGRAPGGPDPVELPHAVTLPSRARPTRP